MTCLFRRAGSVGRRACSVLGRWGVKEEPCGDACVAPVSQERATATIDQRPGACFMEGEVQVPRKARDGWPREQLAYPVLSFWAMRKVLAIAMVLMGCVVSGLALDNGLA